MIVLDTNIVLDLLVFNDPATQSLKTTLAAKQRQWIATPAMRDELARVLGYPKIAARLALNQITAAEVLAQFDGQTLLHVPAIKASVTCADPDDQKFIDLAVAYQATLLSKDNAVLCMTKRLLSHSVSTHKAIDFAA